MQDPSAHLSYYTIPYTPLLPEDASYESEGEHQLAAWHCASGHIVVDVELAGQPAGYMLLDTGANGFVIEQETADRLALQDFGELYAFGIAGGWCVGRGGAGAVVLGVCDVLAGARAALRSLLCCVVDAAAGCASYCDAVLARPCTLCHTVTAGGASLACHSTARRNVVGHRLMCCCHCALAGKLKTKFRKASSLRLGPLKIQEPVFMEMPMAGLIRDAPGPVVGEHL